MSLHRLGVRPWAISNDAQGWRRSWMRSLGGSPAARTTLTHTVLWKVGFLSGAPSGAVKTSPSGSDTSMRWRANSSRRNAGWRCFGSRTSCRTEVEPPVNVGQGLHHGDARAKQLAAASTRRVRPTADRHRRGGRRADRKEQA